MTASPNQMISFHHQFVAFRQSMAFLNKSIAPLAESIDHLPKSLRKRHGICLTGTQMKWAGHQLVLEGSHLIWGGNPWFWRGIALISEGELLLVKVINALLFNFDTRSMKIQNALIEFWKGWIDLGGILIDWGRNSTDFYKEFKWVEKWCIDFQKKTMRSDSISKWNQLKLNTNHVIWRANQMVWGGYEMILEENPLTGGDH